MDARNEGENSGPGAGGVLRLALDLPEGVHYIGALRKTVCCLLESVGVPRQEIEDIELLLGELATNAVQHSGSPGGYRVEIEFHGTVVYILVADRGKGFALESLLPPGTSRPNPLSDEGDAERIGGWGLPLARSIADHLEILPTVPHGTTIRAEKRLRGPTA